MAQLHPDVPPLPCTHAAWPTVRDRLEHLAALGLSDSSDSIRSGAKLVLELDEMRSALGLPPLNAAGFALAAYLDEEDAPAPRAGWLAATLPHVLLLAAQLPVALAPAGALQGAHPLRVLRAGRPGSVAVSRSAAASLLAAAFLCLTPAWGPEGFPCFTLVHVFADLRWPSQVAKADCFLHYFARVVAAPSPRPATLLFTRAALPLPTPGILYWRDSAAPLLPLRIHATGSIEDSAAPLKADFANHYLGGGALGHGAVQEEILFVTHPELCVGMLLCEKMRPHEAVLLRGAQRFSVHEGYRREFCWAGPFLDGDNTPDEDGVLPSAFTAFDALCKPGDAQYTPELMLREANKALVAFGGAADGIRRGAVATGNWGCGAFGGDVALKSLLQWAAASEAGREVDYYAYGDDVAVPLAATYQLLRSVPTVGALFRLLLRYDEEASAGDQHMRVGLWDWLAQRSAHMR